MYTVRWGHKNGVDDNVALFHSHLTAMSNVQDGLIKQVFAYSVNIENVTKVIEVLVT
ncbi:hypothetical protein [Paraglaciecola sp.]|uniref:hypothetical protein n=1 Tax=Paraglaciecola sp. TaxID=1920173 RepID=UPI003EFA7970